jgi:hypothetical protein
VNWLADLWQRMTHRDAAPSTPPPAPSLRRDPDLDAVHREQHDIMQGSGYTAAKIRDSWNEHIKRSWNPPHAR